MIPELHLLPENDPAALPRKPENSWRWATVVSTDPLAVRLDGESIPLATVPTTLTHALSVDQRVWVQMHGRAVIVLGAAGRDTAWLPATFKNGWTDASSSAPVQYRMFHDVVRLRGRASGGTTGSVIFTLPTEFLPSSPLYFPAAGVAGQIEVGTNGDVAMVGAPAGSVAAFDVVQFIPN